jgi:methylmalonyl-CoA mutase
MIKATTMAMSAVLGGADQLVVTPYDEDREDLSNYPPQFARRIARNIQHLLKMESGFDQLNDPAAGSHYIEHTSIQIAEKSWEIFKNIQK